MMFYQSRVGGLHGLNPLTKLTLALAWVVMAFAAKTWQVPAVLVVALLPLAVWGGSARLLVKYTATIALPTLLIIVLFQTLLNEGSSVWFTMGPLRATREGFESGLLTGLRFVVIIAAFLLLLLSTHPGQLMNDLVQRGVSASLAYLVSSTLNLLPTMQARANAIINAQRARGLETEGSFVRRASAVVPLVAPLVLSVLSSADERAMALESRGFRSGCARTALEVVPDTSLQQVLRVALVLVAGAAMLLRLVGFP